MARHYRASLEYEGAGLDVASDFIKSEKILYDLNWKRQIMYELLGQEHVDLYDETPVTLWTDEDTDRVQQIGENVYV